MPDVTVLMAVYNGERHLRPAIDSILRQTHRDFEFLIVDDGSTDGTRAIVTSYRDPRIRLEAMGRNAGLSAALNEGMRMAAAPLIARQDADDLSEPGRLAQQLAVMAARPGLALVGSQAVATNERGRRTGMVRRPVGDAAIRWFSIFDNPFIHTSVMFRADAARALGGFTAAYDPYSQDYDLWCRIMERHPVANVAEPLVRYRVSDTSIIGALGGDEDQSEYQRRFHRIVRELTARQARRVFGSGALSDEETPLLGSLVLGLDRASIGAFLALFERLLIRYGAQHDGCDSPDFRWTLARQFEALAFRTRPAARTALASIYGHALRHHPAIAAFVPWASVVAGLTLGRSGRDRLARVKRRLAGAVPR